MIEAKALTKIFRDRKRGQIRAVDGVAFRCEPGRIFGPVSDKHAQVMQPRRRKQNIVIEGPALRQARGEPVKARLMAELIRRPGLGLDVFHQGLAVIG